MAKKQETKDMQPFLNALQAFGYFRNISDEFQVGIPDIIGSGRGKFFGIEFKSVGELGGIVPAKGHHPFTKTQIKELNQINSKGSGVGIGVIMCGKYFVWVSPSEIQEDGRVDVDRLLEQDPNRLLRIDSDIRKFFNFFID